MSETKKYIVTYNDTSTTRQEAQSILGVRNVQDGVEMMATDYVANDADVLHFEGLGSSVLTLSESDAVALQANENILAVEEDIEMRALVYEDENASFGLSSSSDSSDAAFKANLAKELSDVLAKFGINIGGQLNPQKPDSKLLNQPIPWNIQKVNAPQAWARGVNGLGIKLAIIDTGIANHVDLTVLGGACFVPGISSYNDDNGHGTHCAGIAAAKNNNLGVVGVAPNASLYAVKVLNAAGSGQLSWILAGMTWALQNGMKVVSMSLGSSSTPIVAYNNAIQQLSNAGISVCCAAGNAFQTPFPWVGAPANSHPMAIAVGATDSNNVIAPFSSRGVNGPNWNPVSCVAPGVNINSTWPFPPNSYKVLSGTSMACPHVAGAVALIRQRYPSWSNAQVRARLLTTCTPLTTPGYNQTYGFGIINCDKATL